MKQLRALAEAALTGPWYNPSKPPEGVGADWPIRQFGVTIATEHSPIGYGENLVDYIAAVSPDVVLELLNRIKELENELDYYSLDF